MPTVVWRLISQDASLFLEATGSFFHQTFKVLRGAQGLCRKLFQAHLWQDTLARQLHAILIQSVPSQADLKQLGLLVRQTPGGPFHPDAEPAVLANHQLDARPLGIFDGQGWDCKEGNACSRDVIHSDVAGTNLCMEVRQVVDQAARTILSWLAIDGTSCQLIVLICGTSWTAIDHHAVILVRVVLVLLGKKAALQQDAGRVEEPSKASIWDGDQFRHQHGWRSQGCEKRTTVEGITPA
mmetsp:Transcript_57901/g.91620  ORF Transcript_57901/g.91620 Transcript_57901/m.91620 type:complete len:239 (-) Transcript_57901:85-801(-)